MKSGLRLFVSALIVAAIVAVYFFFRRSGGTAERSTRVRAFLNNPQEHSDWKIQAGQRCGNAPFQMPTNGFIGFVWDDSFRPGHRHQGLDIFGGEEIGKNPGFSAYDGYLTRLAEWKSSIIIRIPQDPLQPNRQIWTYYTHMADPAGKSFIVSDFPPGTTGVFVKAGTLLGYQGNYSGDPDTPTGTHLHFSIVRDDGGNKFRNELDIGNTLDPSPYFQIALNAREKPAQIPVCAGGNTP